MYFQRGLIWEMRWEAHCGFRIFERLEYLDFESALFSSFFEFKSWNKSTLNISATWLNFFNIGVFNFFSYEGLSLRYIMFSKVICLTFLQTAQWTSTHNQNLIFARIFYHILAIKGFVISILWTASFKEKSDYNLTLLSLKNSFSHCG